jgi:hypothetical protein
VQMDYVVSYRTCSASSGLKDRTPRIESLFTDAISCLSASSAAPPNALTLLLLCANEEECIGYYNTIGRPSGNSSNVSLCRCVVQRVYDLFMLSFSA